MLRFFVLGATLLAAGPRPGWAKDPARGPREATYQCAKTFFDRGALDTRPKPRSGTYFTYRCFVAKAGLPGDPINGLNGEFKDMAALGYGMYASMWAKGGGWSVDHMVTTGLTIAEGELVVAEFVHGADPIPLVIKLESRYQHQLHGTQGASAKVAGDTLGVWIIFPDPMGCGALTTFLTKTFTPATKEMVQSWEKNHPDIVGGVIVPKSVK